ncbi:ATP-dependent Clp protease proteolytic subunit [Treponema pedis]|nr:ATP-dependent Clp protease proteolytic subunit [Treponema pedis]QOW60062.1 ATP-dependent Clp protease proteolytic subunit [Treponema pedis]
MAFYNEEDGEEKKNKKNEGQDQLTQKFLNTRQILLTGEINKELSEKIIRQLLLMESISATKPIYIYIDTPGGDADAGFALFDMIRFVKPPVYTIGMGLVASAGSIILLAAKKERRLGLPNSHYLIHQPLSGIKGVATEIEIHARELEKMRVKINKLIAEETGADEKKVAKDTDRDCWLDAEEAIKYGLISKIAAVRKDLI